MDFEEDLSGLPGISDEELSLLCANIGGPEIDPKKPEVIDKWLPKLSPKQFDAFFDDSPNLLLESQRYTGKTWAAGYTVVKHAYDYRNALILVVAKTKRQLLTGGLMSKMGAEILPDFKANITGFTFDGPKLTVEKDVIYRVKNRYGGWSIIQMMSIGNDNDLTRKIKGLEASLIVVDEIVLYETMDIYTHLTGTLGRRNHIPPEAQRFIGTCNPDGPSHWVAKMWSVMDPSKREEGFRVIKFMPEDNPDPKVAAYYARLRQALRHHPTQYKRDIDGLWVDVPMGDAIFKEFFIPEIHVKGDLTTMEFLEPIPGHSISIGWDPGDVNHGVIFLQEIPTKDKILWIAFDEVVFVNKKVSLEQLTRAVMDRMSYWCEQLGVEFLFNHIADRSAFDRFRAPTGSYDCLEIERHYKANAEKYPKLKKAIKIRECPKPAGSVESRTRILMDLLTQEEFFVSARCVNLINTLSFITPKKDNPFAPDTRSEYKHALDATTYPLFYYKTGGLVLGKEEDPALQARVSQVGT